MRSRKGKNDNAEIVTVLRAILDCVERIEGVLTRKRESEVSPTKIMDVDGPLDNEAAIT